MSATAVEKRPRGRPEGEWKRIDRRVLELIRDGFCRHEIARQLDIPANDVTESILRILRERIIPR